MDGWLHNDGGRSKYFKGTTGDCSVRAMAIALNLDYKQCYDELAEENKKTKGKRSVRGGISKSNFETVLAKYGWKWCKAPVFNGRKARCSDLLGVVIARQSKHFVAVIDGVANDTFDSTNKMVYGYWSKGNNNKNRESNGNIKA